jgi:hypothetical protein
MNLAFKFSFILMLILAGVNMFHGMFSLGFTQFCLASVAYISQCQTIDKKEMLTEYTKVYNELEAEKAKNVSPS